jgi:hypothetical protein
MSLREERSVGQSLVLVCIRVATLPVGEGEVVHEYYADGNEASSKHIIKQCKHSSCSPSCYLSACSLTRTKSFISLVVGILVSHKSNSTFPRPSNTTHPESVYLRQLHHRVVRLDLAINYTIVDME